MIDTIGTTLINDSIAKPNDFCYPSLPVSQRVYIYLYQRVQSSSCPSYGQFALFRHTGGQKPFLHFTPVQSSPLHRGIGIKSLLLSTTRHSSMVAVENRRNERKNRWKSPTISLLRRRKCLDDIYLLHWPFSILNGSKPCLLL